MSSAKELIEKMPAVFDAQAAGDLNATVQYAISTPMYAQIGDGSCTVHEGQASAPDVTIIMDDDDLVAMLTGELNGMTAFMTGKLQVDGDIMLAQKLPQVFKTDAQAS
ncbi:MAG: SCP2 sterol-binding domain-containing protein [Salinisphaera sp.]|nr:SCP2 sterol-binding domain-containing protein [Salinisphaera sp.]MDN5938220.1 SCP2 sterol-binding domain-containing protein [Salinisphaera sp.]